MFTPHLKHTLQLWWAITWRVIPASIIIGSALSFVWGMILQLIGFPHLAEIGGSIIMILTNIIITIYVLHYMIHNGFGKTRRYKLNLRDLKNERAKNTVE